MEFWLIVVVAFLAGFILTFRVVAPLAPAPAKENPFYARNRFNIANYTVGAQVSSGSGATRNVAVQLTDANNIAIARIVSCRAYLSDSPLGAALTAATPTTVAIGTNGVILAAIVAGKVFEIITNAVGLFDLTITEPASPNTWYLVIIMPDGSISVSPAIAMT